MPTSLTISPNLATQADLVAAVARVAALEGRVATLSSAVSTLMLPGVIRPPQLSQGSPNPALLPLATVAQAPNTAAYAALNVPAQAAGFLYSDPVTAVSIWKATSATVPNSNVGMGHDYGEGPHEASRGWGTGNNTHTLLLRRDAGSAHWLCDFTRGTGFSNYRQLTGTLTPRGELCFTFSAVAGQERIAYCLNTSNQLVRIDTASMAIANTGFFPATIGGSGPSWLQQDYQDTWIVGLQDATTAFAFNTTTGQLLTHGESWLNEPRLERNGRYVVLTATSSNGNARYWDLSDNSFGATQTLVDFAHCASLRGRWIAVNTNPAAPPPLDRYQVAGGTITRTAGITTNSGGYSTNNSGNWVQTATDDTQWAYISGTDTAQAWQALLLVDRGIGAVRADGSEFRLLCHHYSNNPSSSYYDLVWGKPSPDGKILMFNSNMDINGGRHDLFVAEVPLT